jgi:branched-chain amino acid transport system substrate-binding protein
MKDKPDIVAAAAHGEDAANIARELRRQGYKGDLLGGTPTVSEDYIKIAGDAANGTYVVVPYYYGARTAENEAFVAGYAKATGRKTPDPWEASTYECIGMIAAAMKAAGATGAAQKLAAERKAIRDALAATKSYPGLVGPISFDKDRVAEKPSVVIYVKDGEWRAL